MPTAKELIQSVKHSIAAHKEALEQKIELAKKTEGDQKLVSINEKRTQLNSKKSSLEEAIKNCRLEADKYAFDTEKKEKFDLLKLSNGLKRATEKKQIEFGAILGKPRYLEEKKKHI